MIYHEDHFISLAQVQLSNVSGTSFTRSILCLLPIFKGNPSYTHPNEMRLCKTIPITIWHLHPEDKPKANWASAIGQFMPQSTPRTPKLETNLLLVHLRPYSTDHLHNPIQSIWEFFEIFLRWSWSLSFCRTPRLFQKVTLPSFIFLNGSGLSE